MTNEEMRTAMDAMPLGQGLVQPSKAWYTAEEVIASAALEAMAEAAVKEHPLYEVFMDAIRQAMYGKGQRHGGAVTPFLEQPWAHYVKMHGRGFATGQAAKKLEEAASTREGQAFETEVLGALVYIGMAVLKERGQV